MSSKQKYQNSRCYLDQQTNEILSYRPITGALTKNIICFQSKLEAKVFQIIARHYQNHCVQLQHPIQLKAVTEYSAALKYFCDFVVMKPIGFRDFKDRNESDYLFREAKGAITPEASRKLKMLEIVEPTIRKRLLIVSAKPQFYFGKKYPPSIDLIQLEARLIQFKND
ncbi:MULTISPECIES: hypothetical protein [unclassified Microcoleus]|uniref:hypothetical protein n=1 Tax=unclassified Microcoleus TaxID=2642155 RepID=UPI002FD1ED34